jgi:hypothetical protein
LNIYIYIWKVERLKTEKSTVWQATVGGKGMARERTDGKVSGKIKQSMT